MTRAVDLLHVSSRITRFKQPLPLLLFRATLAWTLILIRHKIENTMYLHTDRGEGTERVGRILTPNLSGGRDFRGSSRWQLNLFDGQTFVFAVLFVCFFKELKF